MSKMVKHTLSLKKLLEVPLVDLFDTSIEFRGWIRRIRSARGMIFIDIYDGSEVIPLRCIAEELKYIPDILEEDTYKTLMYGQLKDSQFLSDGCSVVIEGIITKSPEGASQLFEVKISKLQLIGGVEDPETYPIQKSNEKNFQSLRQLPFDRMKSQMIQSVGKIRSELSFYIHLYFREKSVTLTDPNILTSSDCEGAGEMFKVTPQMFGSEIPVGLTVSAQLPLEALITGYGNVYSCRPCFRAEESHTTKHLVEFLHIEYESICETLDELLRFTEDFIKTIITQTIQSKQIEYDFLESKFSAPETQGIRTKIQSFIKKGFVRIKHCEAVDLIIKLVKEKAQLPDDSGKLVRVKVKAMPKHDGDLSSEHETILVKYFDGFVFVTHWPLKIKSFYMKQCDDGSGECESFDLLAPYVGEMIGGSMREWRYDKLDAEIKRRGMDISPIQWYLELRKSGSLPHGGWGLGFDRLLMLITGSPSVRDCVPFPVYAGHCPY
jgi:asparaginyl-tRNA synthetase